MHLHDRYHMQHEFSPIGIYWVYKIQDYIKNYFSLIEALKGKLLKYKVLVLGGYQADLFQLKEKKNLKIELKIRKM